MNTTYSVRIRSVESRKNAAGKVISYRVRWITGTKLWEETFKRSSQADAFRSNLLAAASKGEAFNLETGRPVSEGRKVVEVSWFTLATAYAASKWAYASPNHRRGIADTITDATEALILDRPGAPARDTLRPAMRWVVSARVRNPSAVPPPGLASTIGWLERNTLLMSTFEEPKQGPALGRKVLDRISRKQNGMLAAASVAQRKRAILNNLMGYAIETGALSVNPLKAVKWTKAKKSEEIDVRVVVNTDQAARLLAAVGTHGDLGERLVAFFGCMYYAALRPEEVAGLQRADLVSLPDSGWGEMLLQTAEPSPGKSWTDDGKSVERRGLKHRAVGAARSVPIHPELVVLLRSHVKRFPVASGDVFRGPRGGRISDSSYLPHFHRARAEAFTPAESASPLARVPYALRHAAVSTWLNAGVAPTQVAQWAGHSVDVLLRVYAKCISGQEAEAKRRILDAMSPKPEAQPKIERPAEQDREAGETGRSPGGE